MTDHNFIEATRRALKAVCHQQVIDTWTASVLAGDSSYGEYLKTVDPGAYQNAVKIAGQIIQESEREQQEVEIRTNSQDLKRRYAVEQSDEINKFLSRIRTANQERDDRQVKKIQNEMNAAELRWIRARARDEGLRVS